MNVYLLERQWVASDLRSQRRIYERRPLEEFGELEANEASVELAHAERTRLLAEGRRIEVVRTAGKLGAPNRARRRLELRLLQRWLKRRRVRLLPLPDERQQQVDRELETHFKRGHRRKSGLVLPT